MQGSAAGSDVRPPGFTPESMAGTELAIDFDGQPAPILHRFSTREVLCESAEGDSSQDFIATYVSAKLTDGSDVVHFMKPEPQGPEYVTLVIDSTGTAALAACHRFDPKRASSRPQLIIIRGAVGRAFSFANLSDFPLRDPPPATLLLEDPHLPGTIEALFSKAGHLTRWRSRPGGTSLADGPASGRLLSISPQIDLLPWAGMEAAGTFVLDRSHGTYWGITLPTSLPLSLSLASAHGSIRFWDET